MKENQRYNKRTESVRKEYKKQEGFNMRKNLGAKAYTYPQPVFILAAYGEDGTPVSYTHLTLPTKLEV